MPGAKTPGVLYPRRRMALSQQAVRESPLPQRPARSGHIGGHTSAFGTAGILALQRTAGNGAVAHAIASSALPIQRALKVQRAFGVQSGQFQPLMGDSGKGVLGLGASSFAGIQGLLKIYEKLSATPAGADPQAAAQVLSKMEALSTKWLNEHRRPRGQDIARRTLVQQLSDSLPAERIALSKKQAHERYASDLGAGYTGVFGQSALANTSTPFAAASAEGRQGAAEALQLGALVEQKATAAKAMPGQMSADALNEAKTRQQVVESAGLTPAEHAAIRLYTGGDFLYLNPAAAGSRGWMKSRKADPQAKFKKDVATTKLMQEGALHSNMASQGLAKMPVFPSESFRGETVTAGQANALKAGNVISVPSLTSTSKNSGTPFGFLSSNLSDDRPVGVLWLYSSGHGRDVSALSLAQGEAEVLVPTGSKFVIMDVAEIDDSAKRPAASTPSGPLGALYSYVSARTHVFPGRKVKVVWAVPVPVSAAPAPFTPRPKV